MSARDQSTNSSFLEAEPLTSSICFCFDTSALINIVAAINDGTAGVSKVLGSTFFNNLVSVYLHELPGVIWHNQLRINVIHVREFFITQIGSRFGVLCAEATVVNKELNSDGANRTEIEFAPAASQTEYLMAWKMFMKIIPLGVGSAIKDEFLYRVTFIVLRFC